MTRPSRRYRDLNRNALGAISNRAAKTRENCAGLANSRSSCRMPTPAARAARDSGPSNNLFHDDSGELGLSVLAYDFLGGSLTEWERAATLGC